jgi:hypothetical protein
MLHGCEDTAVWRGFRHTVCASVGTHRDGCRVHGYASGYGVQNPYLWYTRGQPYLFRLAAQRGAQQLFIYLFTYLFTYLFIYLFIHHDQAKYVKKHEILQGSRQRFCCKYMFNKMT